MNKKRVDGWLLLAREAIKECEIANDGRVNKSFRGQISSFGAAVVMGSFKSAVAVYSENGRAEVERERLIRAAYYVAYNGVKKDAKDILAEVCQKEGAALREMRDAFIDASVAIKLALNFYDLV